ncbi:hypothetical protein F3Y22_tig00004238pilonHSYRG00012 [Hibiscus syriacus]|uniref:Uncharacterized protein n=1 Tax=Hibiscus syriacus TaxID=106335 RepID=A0A6A3CLR5_HIBSY|nr:hypothetical protein F3Y22_tig00004238pilonHSYRG00012 [Hibiscus syriacus]
MMADYYVIVIAGSWNGWYLRKDLAKLVDDDPPAIMLLFEPKGRPEDEVNDFYIQNKQNICVGCGEGNHYLRYRVIPACYRIHFPEHLKSHRSHDIVLLCVDCHEVAHAAAEKYKRQIAGEFGIPLYVRKVVDSNQALMISGSSESTNFEDSGVSPLQLLTAAKALLCHGPEMPPSRRDELTQIVMRYYGGREISNEDLERALVVGMSPHEQRRLAKKKGLSLKQSRTIPPVKKQEINDVTRILSITSDPSKVSSPYASDFTADISHSKEVDTLKETSGTKDDMDFSCHDMNSRSSRISETEVVCGVNIDNFKSSTPNEIANSSCARYEGNTSVKHNKKFSLLGHGPHGKQVVDHILNEFGEEGIRQFCQRWRQVFVEAVHPRFLPGGWDVMHREFETVGRVQRKNDDHVRKYRKSGTLYLGDENLASSACTILQRKVPMAVNDGNVNSRTLQFQLLALHGNGWFIAVATHFCIGKAAQNL